MVRLIFVFCCLIVFSSAQKLSYANDISLMDKFSWRDWENDGAEIFYNNTTKEIRIQKDSFRFEPKWGSAKVEFGTINVSDPGDNNLTFEIVDLDGLYSVTIHYGGRDKYDSQYIKVQDDTDMAGERKYNISRALSDIGLKDEQQIQLELTVIDNDEQPGGGVMVIKNLVFGYDDNFAVIPSR